VSSTPKTTDQLIARTTGDVKSIQGAEEFWRHMLNIKFSQRYHDALIASGMSPGKADELAAVVRQYIERIAGDLGTATYVLRQLTGELYDARQKAGAQATGTGFRI
jgi:hypothetical protein